MIKQTHIYAIYFPTANKYYVGQTIYLEKRMFQHLGSKNLVGRALRKYDDWIIEILHTVKDRDIANSLEIEEIRHYSSIAPNGYNLTRGGDGGDTFTNNPNREKTREIMWGNKNAKGYKFTKEQLEKCRQAHLGRKHSKETIEKMVLNHKGFKGCHHSKETIEKMMGNQHAKGKHWKNLATAKRNKENNPSKNHITVLKQQRTKLLNKIVNLEKVVNG